MGEFKISFCTVCMNRLHHLKHTLLKNIRDNKDYADLEFVLLDYNSTDGLEEYVMNTLQQYIKNGRLKYYKTLSPQYFNRSHSRNLAFKLAGGEIICNVDADNFTGKGFANYINDEFENKDNIFLTALVPTQGKQDVLGRTCVKKENFYKLTGFDEQMINYGFEDTDFVARLELYGIKKTAITDAAYLQAVSHDEKERLSNEYVSTNLKYLFFNYLTPSSTDCLMLFKDHNFKRGTIIDNATFKHPETITPLKKSQLQYEYSVLQDFWHNGTWMENNTEITLYNKNGPGERLVFNKDRNCHILADNNKSGFFYKITHPELIQATTMFFSQTTNRVIMHKNKIDGKIIVNPSDFGKDTVYMNFSLNNPLTIC